MDIINDDRRKIYEVEKIINRKTCRNKKYYLIKWFDYPIYESTWEPKSNLKNVNYLIEEFEEEYPLSIDQNMYKIFCKVNKKSNKKRKKTKKSKEQKTNELLKSKKKRIEFFTKSELKDTNLDKLKMHLHLNIAKRLIKSEENELIIALSSSTSPSEEMLTNEETEQKYENKIETYNQNSQLIKPEME